MEVKGVGFFGLGLGDTKYTFMMYLLGPCHLERCLRSRMRPASPDS